MCPYTSLKSECALTAGCAVHARMLESGFAPTLFVPNCLLQMYARCGGHCSRVSGVRHDAPLGHGLVEHHAHGIRLRGWHRHCCIPFRRDAGPGRRALEHAALGLLPARHVPGLSGVAPNRTMLAVLLILNAWCSDPCMRWRWRWA